MGLNIFVVAGSLVVLFHIAAIVFDVVGAPAILSRAFVIMAAVVAFAILIGLVLHEW